MPGDIEGRSMIDRGADDWDAQRNVHRLLEVDGFHGNVALVVVLRDDQIELSAQGANKDGVGRQRAAAVDAQRARLLDGRSDHVQFLAPEEPVLSGVRIQGADADARRSINRSASSPS